MLLDLALLARRAPCEVGAMSMGPMSTPAACLLLSRFAPAAACVFAEFRRLRGLLPRSGARKFAEREAKGLQHTEMMAAVRLHACPTSRMPRTLHSLGSK